MQGGSILSAPLDALNSFNKSNQRLNYPPSMRKNMEKYGNQKIVNIQVGRKPIQSTIEKALSLFTLGNIEQEKKELHYDYLYHLFLILYLENGKKLKLEKNQVISLTEDIVNASDIREVKLNKTITLNQFIENGRKLQGSAYFTYDVVNNNCQKFVIANLKANGLLTDDLRTFIEQDIKKLVPGFLNKVSNAVTDTAHTVDTLLQGQGMFGGRGMKCNF